MPFLVSLLFKKTQQIRLYGTDLRLTDAAAQAYGQTKLLTNKICGCKNKQND